MAAPIHRDTALCLYASLGPRLLRGTQGLCFEYTDWQVFLDGCSDNPDEFTDTVTFYIQFCDETIISTKTCSMVVVAFSSLARILGDNIRPLNFILQLRFFLKVEIDSRTLIPLFRPGSVHSS